MRLFLIDANGINHWLWHAFHDKDGTEKRSLADATREWWNEFSAAVKPTHAVACFDGKHNWRYEIHPEYKSTRKAKPVEPGKLEALDGQPEVWRSLGLKIAASDRYEADDVIATMSAMFAGPDCEVIVVATDKDMMQLVDKHVKQYDPRPNKDGACIFYDAEAVEAKLGVPPSRVVDLLSVMGDTSDDVPGVDGWGRVAAINAIKQTKSFTELKRKALAGELKSISKEKQCRTSPEQKAVPFSEQLAQLELSRNLVTLRLDVPLVWRLEDFQLLSEAA